MRKAKKQQDYYDTLNIKPDAGPSEIRKAYRKAVKKYHPDVSTRNGEIFRKVQEAYETLSDPEKKTAYDRKLSSREAPSRHPEKPVFSSHYSFDLFDDTDRYFSDLVDFWLGSVPDFFDRRVQRPREQSVEIILSPEEASQGGEIDLDVPVRSTCRRCAGKGRINGLICGRCRGRGEEESEAKAVVMIPRRAIDGMRIRVPVDLPGRKLELLIMVKVQD